MIFKKEDTKNYIKFLNLFVSKYAKKIVLCIFISIISMFCMMLNPIISRYIVDNILLLKNVTLLYKIVGILLLITIITSIIQFAFTYTLNKIFLSIGNDLKKFIFGHIINLELSLSNKISIGQMNSRLFNDTEILKSSFGQIIFGGIFNFIFVIILTIYLLFTNISLSLIILIGELLQILLFIYFPPKIRIINYENKRLNDNVITRTLEIFNSLYLLKSCNCGNKEIKRFNKNIDIINKISLKESLLNLIFSQSSALVIAGIQFSVIGYGGFLVAHNNLTLGGLTAFIVIVNMLTSPLASIVTVVSSFQDSLASLKRILEIINLKGTSNISPVHLNKQLEGNISIKNLTFRYDKFKTILKDINIDLKANGIYSIVGKSGVGKSTLCLLIAQFYKPTEGSILIDNININEIDIESYRKNVGILLQNHFLFSGTIKENILLGNPNATDNEIVQAAKLANAHEFISKLPDGYFTQVGKEGNKLSGGQLQRISLARLFLQKPSIIILDEPTSFLDIESEELIKKSIIELSKESTIIMITHKIETAKIASKIILLDEGTIKEVGSHNELIQFNGLYNNLYKGILSH